MEATLFSHSLAPMGVPVRIVADDSELLATACAAYPELLTQARVASPPIEISLTTTTQPSTRISCDIAVEGSRLRLDGPDFTGEADWAQRTARCSVPLRLFGDPEALATEVLDTLLLFLLARSGRTPIHAAGVVARGTALILAGPSGSGKSSLALAAARRGLRLLSDDMVYVQLEPNLRLWGLPRPIHLFPEDAPHEAHAIRLRNGKRKAVVQLGSFAPFAERAIVVLLARGLNVDLAEVEPAEALRALTKLEPGFDLLVAETGSAAQAIVGDGAWRLTLGDDPVEAIDYLLQRLAPR